MASLYRYSSLLDARSIRVLELEPARDESSPLIVQLHKTGLGEKQMPRYEAISYVWGPPDFNCSIICNGDTLHITQSCESLLYGLRRRFRRRLLWIDSVCIDQSNVTERSQQVSVMHEVYTSAHRVLIWLSVSMPEAASFSAYVTKCARHCSFFDDSPHNSLGFPIDPFFEQFWRIRTFLRSHGVSQCIPALTALVDWR